MRHAQKHWLETQARSGVEFALLREEELGVDAIEVEVREIVEMAERIAPGRAGEFLAEAHAVARHEVAQALIKAELLHREITQRGEAVLRG